MAKTKPAPKTPASIHPHLTALALFLITAIFAMIRMRLLDLPLERDEGEYAYAGQLILHGIPPYRLLYNMKWPGTYAMYAVLMAIFGETVAGIRIGMIVITSATAICLYFLTARMLGRVAGVVAAAANLLLSITLASMGTYAHATHFVALFAVAGLMLLVHQRPAIWSALGAGVLLALAALMKQPGMFFGFFAAAWLLASKRVKDTALVAGGATITGALTVAILAAAGVFDRFKLWTIDYARQYVSQVTFADGVENLRRNFGSIYEYSPLLWWIALAGLVLLFVEPIVRKHWTFVLGFTIASALATAPGLYFRPHYFLVLFPAIAMLNGVAVSAASRLIPWRAAAPIAFAIAFALSLGKQWPTLVGMDAMAINRMRYGGNPFEEAIEVASYLRDHTAPDDRIAVLGSEPEIYFYAGRKSATGYIYTYPLMEKQSFAHHMQQEMIAEVEQAKPKYIVTVSAPSSWLARPDSDRTIFEWMDAYIKTNYTLDGIADLLPGTTEYKWGTDAQQYQPRTGNVLMVFKRR